MNKWIQFAGSLLLFWLGIALALKSELTVFRVVEYYLPNWIAATIMLRLLVITLLFLAGQIMTGRISRMGKYLTAIILLVPIADAIMIISGQSRFYSLFLFSDAQFELLVQLVFCSLAFVTLLLKKTSHFKHFGQRWMIIPFVLAAIGASFIRPVYVDDWYNPEKTQSKLSSLELNSLLHQQGVTPESDRFMIAFFESSCGYCAWAATKMGVNQRNDKLPELIIVFPGDLEDANQFLEDYNLRNVPHFVLEREHFLELAGNSYPSIFLVTDNKTLHWTGSGFGYRVLEYISP